MVHCVCGASDKVVLYSEYHAVDTAPGLPGGYFIPAFDDFECKSCGRVFTKHYDWRSELEIS